MIKDDNLEFDLILVRLRSKIALSSGWPPTSNQSFLPLCSHKGHKASKIVSASDCDALTATFDGFVFGMFW